MTQERAARTRRLLLQAAATEFAENGYEGTSFARICALAGISMGALTFHFPTKGRLAQAVQEQGCNAAGAAVTQVLPQHESALQGVVEATLCLARLLEKDPLVRAAARLARELPGSADSWLRAWRPTVCRLLHRAADAGELRPDADREVVAQLVAHLVAGTEWYVWARSAWPGGAGAAGTADEQLARIWELALPGIAARWQPDGAARPPGRANSP
ncbi:ScbR family autoregulator-binding transcription factor [Streptomyces griseicoloratus]|uniref:ScbR family autoregulator-binding transcription factor n=1 Tax=Streptomyces griseicoloratus TaxID=2752516 RepID=UPI0028121242|nr:ScbR family autoregulator-binding transcription factor [Streptomyces griseicoloratus]